MQNVCSDCAAELDHCHGTLIEHHDDGFECSEADCVDIDLVRHELRVDCGSIVGSCACVIFAGLAVAA